MRLINDDDKLLAIIFSKNSINDGISFITPPSISQQLGAMKYKKGKVIQKHYHCKQKREIYDTIETIIVFEGLLQVDIYNNEKLIANETIGANELIMLIHGGHGFKVLEDIKMIEIKQGPYSSSIDKIHF